MLFPFYTSVKSRLQNQVADLKDIQWYNNQYAGIIHTEPLALVEFPDAVDIVDISKSSCRVDITIKVHVISKAIADSDNAIPDSQVENHEDLVALVKTALKDYVLLDEDDVALGSRLVYRQYRIVQEYSGWLVNHLTFTTKMTP